MHTRHCQCHTFAPRHAQSFRFNGHLKQGGEDEGNIEGDREWQIDGRKARGARCIFCVIHKHKAPFYLCINKLYSIHFSVVSSVGIQSFMEEANLSKVPAFYRLGEEVGFPATTV